MSPILGILTSSRPGAANSYESIATTTVGSGGTAAITFSSIPSTYQHLQIRAFYTNSGGILDDANWTFNGDTTAGNYYAFHQLRGNGASVTGVGVGSGTSALSPYGANTTIFTTAVVDLLDYSNANKYKTGRSLVGYDFNGSGDIFVRSSLWMSTAAINSVTITANTGTFVQYSSFALYGIKG